MILNNLFEGVIIYIEQRFKTWEEFTFVEMLNPKLFHTYEKNFLIEVFSILDVYKNILDLDGLKCEPKSVCTADFAE